MKNNIEILYQMLRKPHLCQNCRQSVLTFPASNDAVYTQLQAGEISFPFCPHCLKYFIPKDFDPLEALRVLTRQYNDRYLMVLEIELIEITNGLIRFQKLNSDEEFLSASLTPAEALSWLDGFWTGMRMRRKSSFQTSSVPF